MAEPRYIAEPAKVALVADTLRYVNAGYAKQINAGQLDNLADEVSEELFRTPAIWEVIDRTRKPLSRVICRTNRADAMMIVEALNHRVAADEIINRSAERTMRRMVSPTASNAKI